MVGALLTAAAVGALPTYLLAGWLIGRSRASHVSRAGGWGGSAIIDNQCQQMNRSAALRRHSPRITRFRDALMGHLYIDKEIRFRPMPLSFIKGASKFRLRPEEIIRVGCSSDGGVIFLHLQGDDHEIPITVRQPQGLRYALVRVLGQDRVQDYRPSGSLPSDSAGPVQPDPYRDPNREAW